MGQAEKSWDDLNAIVQRDLALHRQLGEPVENYNGSGDQEVKFAHGERWLSRRSTPPPIADPRFREGPHCNVRRRWDSSYLRPPGWSNFSNARISGRPPC